MLACLTDVRDLNFIVLNSAQSVLEVQNQDVDSKCNSIPD